MHGLRIDGTAPDILRKWFDEYKGLIDRHHYRPSEIFNMDETGFAIGATQRSQVLVVKSVPQVAGDVGVECQTAELLCILRAKTTL